MRAIALPDLRPTEDVVWHAGQQEFAICFKVDGNGVSSNTQSEIVTHDVLFQNNRISHAPAATEA